MQVVEKCDPCMILKKTSFAKHICVACEEKLCEECVKDHARRKATAFHTPIAIPNTTECPGKPRPLDILSDNITLSWEPPLVFGDDDYYQISYKEIGCDRRWRYFPGEYKETTATLSKLKSNASFVFRDRAVYLDREGPYSAESDALTTCQSPAFRFATVSTNELNADSSPTIFPVPVTETTSERHKAGKIRTFEIGEPLVRIDKSKTIILVGATGSGKSTLVDGLINYVLGVNWDDTYRFTVKVVTKGDAERRENKALSQEDWITCYTLNPENGSRLSYQLNIIDTPGFGDIRGMERDQAMVDQVRILFSEEKPEGISNIDAVCFLLKAPDARLTLPQMYIFQSVMSLFGNDVERNICSLITFADGKEPPVLAAMKASGLPFGCTFAFNNCALYAKNVKLSNASLSPMFWDISVSGFRSFFEYLDGVESCSLEKTRDVLRERSKLDAVAKKLQPLIDSGLLKTGRLRQEQNEISETRRSLERNKNFEIEVTEEQQRKRDLPRGQYVTNCLHCNISCHVNCTCSIADKAKCSVMNAYGYCNFCPGKCHWQHHATTPYIFERVTVKVKKTYPEMQQKYFEQTQRLCSQEILVKNLKQELNDIFDNSQGLMAEFQKCTNRLKEIALQGNPFVMLEEHLDVLLENEKLERKEGFMQRISLLKEMQKRACMLQYFEQFQEESKKL
ncbi:uncharacterized protein LOC123556761 [Mercenaria mercenaria]|uniref:uncharacterized protein LOC123556761 n=1 Tax=Mercenaria mercenaria TaxID=6596 RepID=UPI00234FA2DC|nr:uncharacterized protein LOC123556761 [Mercenaria mercenaria]XP_045203646.2 uncharacterized protein LOC123556761 [Mercenaria mercenaria]XP_045203647.2 uncharacterized protein LOC123556761 [Mercenaria mercenaria]XP_045203648.2 uncharacterized protein LOC123556761 [Mercenaria mercenaria]